MKQSDFFGSAKWVSRENAEARDFVCLRQSFRARAGETATLYALGLGFFKCSINGQNVNPDTFLPLSSDYEATADPIGEVLSGHRVYVPHFDVSEYLIDGENTLEMHFGGGWYTARVRTFGLPKAIWRLAFSDRELLSNETAEVYPSFVSSYDFTTREEHDTLLDRNTPLGHAVLAEPLVTEYLETDCPPDALIETLSPTRLGEGANGGILYDAGRNLTGTPLLTLGEGAMAGVKVLFSEELTADGDLDETHAHGQCFSVRGRAGETAEALFTWFGFRYFEVIGDAVPSAVKVIHADVSVSSSFDSSSETLNWIYRTFIDTMRANMHTGHPSDCPHIERRGYTGDGQLTCHAALSVFDGEAFYRKWLSDIGDCQNTLDGHIQYTAPYVHSGGGPGGWGSAIVEVPYQLYRHTGDASYLEKYYRQMRRYIDYLEEHSEFCLVTSDKAGDWCLGDWCGPNILYPECDITFSDQQVMLPAPMVNTYFMVKSLDTMAEIAEVIGKEGDAPEYRAKAAERRRAITAAYFNTFDGNFVMNVQGANAYAVDLGLGDERTYQRLVSYYTKLGHYDTGIFATDILTRVLFEKGDAALAVELLVQNGAQGYEHWRRSGATTFHEYWDSNRSRSHNHPMFGAPVAYLFEYLLGIRQRKGTAGYSDLLISPMAPRYIERMSGEIMTPRGKVAVSYATEGERVSFSVTIPDGISASFAFEGKSLSLLPGENTFTL